MTDKEKDRIMKMMPELKNYRTINEIAEVASKFLDKYEIVDKDVVSGEDTKEKIDYIKQVMKKVNYKDLSCFKNNVNWSTTRNWCS